jgi:hypothetical protein
MPGPLNGADGALGPPNGNGGVIGASTGATNGVDGAAAGRDDSAPDGMRLNGDGATVR